MTKEDSGEPLSWEDLYDSDLDDDLIMIIKKVSCLYSLGKLKKELQGQEDPPT